MKKLNILVLMHEDLVPDMAGYPDNEIVAWKTEYDVVSTLTKMGHNVYSLGVVDDLGVIRQAISDFKPDIAFNLLEEFLGNSLYDYHVVSYLELLTLPYTGCNPRGLMIARDKALTKKLFAFHRINTPRFTVIPLNKKVRVPKALRYPIIVKSVLEEGSYGLSQASVVYTEDKLLERVEFLHDRLNTPVLAEEYIAGRELYLSIIGNQQLQTLPALELVFGEMPEDAHNIATSRVKWNWRYQKEHQIAIKAPDGLDPQLQKRLTLLGKRIYRILGISGYARVDLRLTDDNHIHVLEVNANPDIGYGDELAMSAALAGFGYDQLLQKVLNLGMKYRPELARL